MDYFGEQSHWPNVASSFGQMDIAGFPKPHAYWYFTNWLAMHSITDPGRPALPASDVSRVLSLNLQWGGNLTGIVSTSRAALVIDGRPYGQKQVSPGQQIAWTLPPKDGDDDGTAVNNATLVALDSHDQIVAAHTVLGPGKAVGLRLSIDVPSPSTGTGDKLVLDGHDASLLRLELVDSRGRLAFNSEGNASFEIVSGPGRLAGIANGDPASHQHPTGSTTDTFGGLARAIVQVSVDCTSPLREAILLIDADPQAGHRTTIAAECPNDPIIVKVSVLGLGEATAQIPVSGDVAKDSPEPVASSALNAGAFSYFDKFEG